MKKDVEKEVKRLHNLLDRMENGLYTGIKIGWITDRIAWLWKFHQIDYDTMSMLCMHATRAISMIGAE